VNISTELGKHATLEGMGVMKLAQQTLRAIEEGGNTTVSLRKVLDALWHDVDLGRLIWGADRLVRKAS